MTSLNALPTWLLSRASHRAHSILTEHLSLVGARGYEYRILEALAGTAPLSQVAIGSSARLDRRDVAVTLANLEESGLIDRNPDPDDARRNVVEITEAGQERFLQLTSIVADVQEEVLAPLDDEMRATFVSALCLLQPRG